MTSRYNQKKKLVLTARMRTSLLVIIAVLAVVAVAIPHKNSPRPIFVWSNTNSLAVEKKTQVSSRAEAHEYIESIAKKNEGDLIVFLDHTMAAQRMADLLATPHAEASTLKQTLEDAQSKILLPHLGLRGVGVADSIIGSLAGLGDKYQAISIRNRDEATRIQRQASTNGKFNLYIVDVTRLGGIGPALEILKAQFNEKSLPFVAVYAGERFGNALGGGTEAGPEAAGSQTFRPRFTRDKVAYGAGEYDNRGLFEKYTFFSAGIWMGILVVLILLTIGISGFAGLAALQTPTQFEKKPNLAE